ncbi:hypothetical protein [Candidatus Methanoliparum sp. LAM-1]|uniref:hypothetical protein n=1 Tax=Candidatus Methanoliparum sp. LAM-1 TaxID=2874846 RepID=UPI001E3C6BC3|nr:hypothetical protein [Candidatus Methanoliparum sp. LAM-1]BDC35424.1 hypothetical protein MTLP_01060 [Candidatus Methanoliparum sp. LAM-1]
MGFGERVIEKVCRMSDVLYELKIALAEFIMQSGGSWDIAGSQLVKIGVPAKSKTP